MLEHDATIPNRFQRNLIGLITHLETKLLTFLHDLAIDDRGMRSLVVRHGSQSERTQRNFCTACSAALGNPGRGSKPL